MKQEPRIYYGDISPQNLADALMSEFNRGNFRTQVLGNSNHLIVQISTHNNPAIGGSTALTIHIRKVADGVSVLLGNQSWLGIAASIGQTAMSTWMNPWNLINRLDDLAQDIESIQLTERAWKAIENYARSVGISMELSERLKGLSCPYCTTKNSLDASTCVSCGAPLGSSRLKTCLFCGFAVTEADKVCPNCKKNLY